MVLCPSKEKEINLHYKLKSYIEIYWMSKCFKVSFQYFRKQNLRRRRAERLPRCSQTLTLGRFRVLLEIQLRYFNLVWWFPICLEVADQLAVSDNTIELFFWPSFDMVSNKLLLTIIFYNKLKIFGNLEISLNPFEWFEQHAKCKKCKLLNILLFYIKR